MTSPADLRAAHAREVEEARHAGYLSLAKSVHGLLADAGVKVPDLYDVAGTIKALDGLVAAAREAADENATEVMRLQGELAERGHVEQGAAEWKRAMLNIAAVLHHDGGHWRKREMTAQEVHDACLEAWSKDAIAAEEATEQARREGRLEQAEKCGRSGAEIPCRFCAAWAVQYRIEMNRHDNHTHFGEPCRAPDDCPDGLRAEAEGGGSDE